MATEFPLALFPGQLFPDVELKEVIINDNNMVIAVTDSEWAISDDMVYFFGPGEMVFNFSGAVSIEYGIGADKELHSGDKSILKRIKTLDFIRKQDDSLLFQFGNRKEKIRIMIHLAKIAKIEWTGDADEDMLELEADVMFKDMD